MNASLRKFLLGAALAGALGAIAVDLALSSSVEAATQTSTLDSAAGVTEATISELPDGGCQVRGCTSVGIQGLPNQTTTCFPNTEITKASWQNGCAILLNYVERRNLAKLNFAGIDGGQ